MTSVQTVATAAHVAYLNPMTGIGMLVCPRPDDDMRGPAVPGRVVNGLQTVQRASLHESDRDAIVRRLYELGWTFAEDESGSEIAEGATADGREVLGLLCSAEPIIARPTMEELAAAHGELCSVVGLQ